MAMHELSLSHHRIIATAALVLLATSCEDDKVEPTTTTADAAVVVDAGEPTTASPTHHPSDNDPETTEGPASETAVELTVGLGIASSGATSSGSSAPGIVQFDGLLHATGLGSDDTPLADGEVDPHWSVRLNGGSELTPYVQTEATGYVGFWMRPSETSKFISPFSDTIDSSGNGQFIYETAFTLVDAPAAQDLMIYCASDNEMLSVEVNGNALSGVVGGSYSTFQALAVPADFLTTGANAIEFLVNNSGGPTGFRAEFAWVGDDATTASTASTTGDESTTSLLDSPSSSGSDPGTSTDVETATAAPSSVATIPDAGATNSAGDTLSSTPEPMLDASAPQ